MRGAKNNRASKLGRTKTLRTGNIKKKKSGENPGEEEGTNNENGASFCISHLICASTRIRKGKARGGGEKRRIEGKGKERLIFALLCFRRDWIHDGGEKGRTVERRKKKEGEKMKAAGET